jgi:Smg protein
VRAPGLYTRNALAYSPRNVFDVLVYLYENYGALHACPDPDSLTKKLTAAGFDDEEISEALAWLSGLEQITQQSVAVGPESERAFRIYATLEVDRLGRDAIGFLSFLEHASQLTPTQREIVIERALATDEAPVPLAMMKVIVLMVLWSQQADIDALLLEELLGDAADRQLH